MSTFVYNIKKKELYISNEYPDTIYGFEVTAHQKLLIKKEWEIEDCAGGSIKSDGTIEFRSKSINEVNFGMIDIEGTKLAEEIRKKIYENRQYENRQIYKKHKKYLVKL